MTNFLKILCVAFGGGLGASLRHLILEFFRAVAELPEVYAVMVVNVLGCFLIGLTFIVIEGIYRRDGTSRLRVLPTAKRLEGQEWWLDGDPTLPAVDLFRFNQNAELLAGFVMTGLLGAMTTFSLFSLLTLQSLQADDLGIAIANVAGSVALGFLAVSLGFQAGHRLVGRVVR